MKLLLRQIMSLRSSEMSTMTSQTLPLAYLKDSMNNYAADTYATVKLQHVEAGKVFVGEVDEVTEDVIVEVDVDSVFENVEFEA
jgi:hypothetical protein